jgi:heptosyltransferase-2
MLKTDIRSILVRAPNWIGDAVLCLPALEKLKTDYPEAEITVLARPWVSPVFFNNPVVKRIIDYDASGRHHGIAGKWRLTRELKKNSFDMAVLLQNAFEAALIAFLTRIPVRVGYATDLRGWFLSHPVKLDPEIRKRHQVFYYLNIISKVKSQESEVRSKNKDIIGDGFELDKKIKPNIYLTAEEKTWAEDFLQGKGIGDNIVVGIAPGASYGPAKRWLAEGFGEVARRLVDEYETKVVLFGGKDDRSICNGVLNGMQGINLAGEVDLRKSIALLSRCNLFITNDSGLMHIAASLGVPTVAIFGSTDPKLTGPLGDNVRVIKKEIKCSPCFERECREGHYNCMKIITAQDVYDAATVFLERKGMFEGA